MNGGTAAPEIHKARVAPSRGHAGLPSELEADAARRLRIAVLLYAFVFFVVAPLTAFLSPTERSPYYSNALRWVPPAVSIAAALVVAGLTRVRRIPVSTVLRIGLIFEVIGSYGIATAQYLNVGRYSTAPPWAGLSWVAVWMLGYTTMIPSPPRAALVAALCSASAVPVVTAVALATYPASAAVSPLVFTMSVVVPYFLVVLIGYTGNRIVYRLGTQLKHARELGSYRLTERLGEGGMGEVWRAEHRLLARPAAIKLIRAGVGQMPADRETEFRARFEREAQATSSLRSPHTIELYDFGVADDGTFFYVMEFLDGFDLQALVERFGPVPASRAACLLKQVCHSLAEAHDRGLVHRDVKPANVFACRYGRDVDFVKVLDFGLVKTIEHDLAVTRSDFTAVPAARGTPAFMAPEQALGNRPVDGRSDIYALGCLGYWLVTGEHVFHARTLMESIVKHVNTPPDPPSRHTELAVPAAFDDLIVACLAKDPSDRPSSAEIVAARLDSLPGDGWGPEQARRWWDVHYPENTLAI